MMQYLVILLDDTSVAYCHCDNPHRERRLMPLETLRDGIRYAMKHNLMIQFVYPDYDLPQDYLDAIDTIDHHDIVPFPRQGDVAVAENSKLKIENSAGAVVVLRMKKAELFVSGDTVAALLRQVQRLNIVITDLDTFTDADLLPYGALLDRWAALLKLRNMKFIILSVPVTNLAEVDERYGSLRGELFELMREETIYKFDFDGIAVETVIDAKMPDEREDR